MLSNTGLGSKMAFLVYFDEIVRMSKISLHFVNWLFMYIIKSCRPDGYDFICTMRYAVLCCRFANAFLSSTSGKARVLLGCFKLGKVNVGNSGYLYNLES